MQIALSYFTLEWWYRHLADELSRGDSTVQINPPHHESPGYALENDIGALLARTPNPTDCYIGSVGALYRGITDLPIPTAMWSDYIPGNEDYIPAIRMFDLVFATQKDSVPILRQAGVRQVEWMPYGFDDSIPNNPEADKEFDVAFVGSLEQPATAKKRRAVLDALKPFCRMNDFLKPCFGADLFRTYNRARMVVNVPVPGGFNMRTFEAVGCGALLLTEDVGNGQSDIFKDGEHLVIYRSIPDLVEKVKYYLANDREREGIARRGMELVLSQHTYRQRAITVREALAAPPARTRNCDLVNAMRAYMHFYEWNRRPDLMARMIGGSGVPLSERIALGKRTMRTLASLIKRGRK